MALQVTGAIFRHPKLDGVTERLELEREGGRPLMTSGERRRPSAWIATGIQPQRAGLDRGAGGPTRVERDRRVLGDQRRRSREHRHQRVRAVRVAVRAADEPVRTARPRGRRRRPRTARVAPGPPGRTRLI